MTIKIGIDLDNTIINYDKLFLDLAKEKKLIKRNLKITRQSLRKIIKKESIKKWKTIQSTVYSEKIKEAKINSGVLTFFKKIINQNKKIFIVSHKTKFPYIGKKKNLHSLSKKWISKNLIKKINNKNFDLKSVYFEETEKKKIKRIRKLKCQYFIDDLPSILKKLSPKIKKILFDPNNANNKYKDYKKIKSWKEISKISF